MGKSLIRCSALPNAAVHFPTSLFQFPNSADAPRANERRERKHSHHYRIGDSEAQQPQGRAMLPLLPNGERGPCSENGEKRARSLVEKLACDPPESTQRDLDRAPQCRKHIRTHTAILVRFAPLVTGFSAVDDSAYESRQSSETNTGWAAASRQKSAPGTGLLYPHETCAASRPMLPLH